MALSRPANPITILDVPDAKNLSGRFKYNFFLKDERINDSGELSDNFIDFLGQSTSATDAGIINKNLSEIPRFAELRFNKAISKTNTIKNENKSSTIFNQEINSDALTRKDLIKNNFDKIIIENLFFKDEYIGINFQDNNIDGKLFTIVSGTIENKIAANNTTIIQNIQEEKENLFDELSKTNSLLDKAKSLKNIQIKNASNEFIINSLTRIENLGARFIDDKTKEEIVINNFESVRNLSLPSRINKKFIGKITENIANDPMSIFSDEFSSFVEPAKTLTQLAIAKTSKRYMDLDTFKQLINDNKILKLDALENNNDVTAMEPLVEVVGYYAEKHEVLRDGTTVKHPPIIVENPERNIIIDSKIKYGSRYLYTVRAVSVVQFTACSDEFNTISAVKLLIASKKSNNVIVDCIERIPPPPPADFDIIWNRKENAPTLMWKFPVNPQRDIKKFQVFRRKNVSEPFEMIREYDFDDSVLKTRNLETPDLSLVTKSSSPILIYTDKEFTRNLPNCPGAKTSKFIYAVGCVDAHMLVSNYSQQFEASFNVFKNKLEKKLISDSNAPKSYPNMFLKTKETFVDTIKTSGKSKINFYFNPDFYKITRSPVFQGKDVKTGLPDILLEEREDRVFETDRTGGFYKMNIINVDFQKQQNIKIKISDKRKNDKEP